MIRTFKPLYFKFSEKTEKYNVSIMRISLAIVYIWFGALKIFGMTPAGDLVEKQFIGFNRKYLFQFLVFVK